MTSAETAVPSAIPDCWVYSRARPRLRRAARSPPRGDPMKRLKLALLGTAMLLLSTAAPASAITYGQLDAGEHPYVGFMIFFSPSDPGWFSCSGTLLDSTTFLTAGHCTFPVGTDSTATA